MTSINEVPVEENVSTFELNFSSNKAENLMKTRPLNKMTPTFRNENADLNRNTDFNSVYCFGDGPPSEIAYRNNQKLNRRIDVETRNENKTFANSNKPESEGKAADSTTPTINKRQRLLDWLKASQAKRDENNRQVFSRWIEKKDNERQVDAGVNSYTPRTTPDINPACFYCDQLPSPIDLYSAISTCAGVPSATPTVYVGFPPTGYPISNQDFYICNNNTVSRPSPNQTARSHYNQRRNDLPHNSIPVDGTHNLIGSSLNDDHIYEYPTNSECQDKLNNFDQNLVKPNSPEKNGALVWPSMLSNSSLNYSNSPIMFPMPYVSYMAYSEGQHIPQNIPMVNSSGDTQNTEVCQLPISNLPGNSPLINPGLNMPIIVGCNESLDSAQNQINLSTSSLRLPSLNTNQYPHIGGYFVQPNIPNISANRESYLSEQNYQYNNVGTPVLSALNFNMQQWMSILGDINQDNTKEQSDMKHKND